MATKAGLHVVSGSRNGYGQVVGMACVVGVNEGGALVEARQNYNNTVTIFRVTNPYPFYLEAPEGIDQWNKQTAINHANWIYPYFVQKWKQNPADYYIVLNEPFSDQDNIDVYLAYERQLMDLAHEDGYKICMLNLAGGSPSWDAWHGLVVPHLAYGYSLGHIYGRHAYGGDLMPLDGNTGRPFKEAEYLRSQGLNGGIVITELGVHGGYGYHPDLFMSQYPQYDLEMKKHPNIIGACWWTVGDWTSSDKGNSNYQDSLGWFSEYVGNNPANEWTPEDTLPPTIPDFPPTFESIRIMQNAIKSLTLDENIQTLANKTITITYELEGETMPPIDPTPPPDNDEFYIIDISKWQRYVDWQYLIGQGVKAVYIRMSQGKRLDEMAMKHYQDAKAHGLYVGFYHYLDVRYDIDDQATFFSDHVIDLDYDMPLAVDVEENEYSPLPNLDQLEDFVLQIRPIDERLVIYTSKYYYDRVSTTNNLGCELWVANYTSASSPAMPKAWSNWHLWQFTSSGFEAGQSLDVNRFNGSYTDFEQWLLYDNPNPPSGEYIDVWSYMFPTTDNVTYEVRHQDGSQERIQNQHGIEHHVGIQSLFIVKGENQGYYEYWYPMGDFIYLTFDTSPANDSQGNRRYYTVDAGKWCKRFMRLGEWFNDGGHYVQFYAKSDCRELPENSGYAENNTQLIAHIPTFAVNGLVLQDCIKIGNPNGEVHIFAKGIGRVAWYSAWGSSEISELHNAGDRPVIEREAIGCM